MQKAILLLGTATPSVETYYLASTGKFKMMRLFHRYHKKPMPEFVVVDIKKDNLFTKKYPFTTTLIRNIKEVLDKKEQVILFLNRRGFAHYAFCKRCGYVFKCQHCNITLTYHKKEGKLICHYCGYAEFIPQQCPECGSSLISFSGAGTEKIEELLTNTFQNIKVSRLDRDVSIKKGKSFEIISEFEKGNINILTGTQIITRGFNFPDVTLVGILYIDELLNLPEFKSAENTFTLITQVAGRAGRFEKPGKVIIQTFIPQHYVIKLATEYKIDEFYRTELNIRRRSGYPPFVRLIRILFEGKKEENVKIVSQKYTELLYEKSENCEILGPSPAPISKIKNKFRYHTIIKTLSPASLKNVLKTFPQKEKGTQIIIDIDPISLM